MNGYFRTLIYFFFLSVFSAYGHSATFNVTTVNDTVGGMNMSLRDAINAANADSENSTIILGSGLTYELTTCGTFDDANATGDLDHTEAFELTVQGNGSTIQQTCTGDRIFHNHAVGSLVVLNDVTITGGNVGLTDFGGGIWMVEGDLEINNSTIANNEAGESGGRCPDG